MSIKIIAIGKRHESWVSQGIERYEKRLTKTFQPAWDIIPHSSREGIAARHEESQRIILRLKPDEYVVLLDETGTSLDSPALSRKLDSVMTSGKNIVFIIGGAYGVDASVHTRAELTWSLSPLVFPHQLVRLILAEQLYRAQEIRAGHPYHHA